MLRHLGANAFFLAFIVLFFFIGPFFTSDSLALRISSIGIGCQFAAVLLTAPRNPDDTPLQKGINTAMCLLGTALLIGGVALYVIQN